MFDNDSRRVRRGEKDRLGEFREGRMEVPWMEWIPSRIKI